MNRPAPFPLFVVLASALILLLLAASAPASTERRVALVIGNADYPFAPLRNPANDARAMAASLEQLGFETTLVLNADRETLWQTVRTFGDSIAKGGVGLFYFAGHGMQVQGRNYLVPVDADVRSEEEVPFQAVDAALVLSRMERAGNRLNIIVLDACRDNPFARSFRSSARGLAEMDAPVGTLLVYATAPGSVASDGHDEHGLFTEALLAHLAEPNLDVELMLRRVRNQVLEASQGIQTPWTASSLRSGFMFNPGAPGSGLPDTPGMSTAALPPSPQAQPRAEPAKRMERLTFHATGTSQAKERLSRLIESKNSALSEIRRQALETFSGPPHLLGRAEIEAILDQGEIVELEYSDEGRKVEMIYEVWFPELTSP